MTAEQDIARILDRLTDRVDRLENSGETESEVNIFEERRETVAFSDDVSYTAWQFGNDRFIPGFGRDAIGFGRPDSGLQIIITRG